MHAQRQLLRERLALKPASIRDATKIIVEHHYLHRGRTMAQLAYWIELDDELAGVILFALPRLSVTFHGYHPMTLIELARLWLDPRVQGRTVVDSRGVAHREPVAGHAVAGALRRVRQDWHAKYPNLPQLRACVAWADLSLHVGTVYRATNFKMVGFSGGKPPGNWVRPTGGKHKMHSDYKRKKAAFLYRWTAQTA